MDDKTLGRRAEAFLDAHDPADRIAFRGAQFDAGLACVHHPEGCGGGDAAQGRLSDGAQRT